MTKLILFIFMVSSAVLLAGCTSQPPIATTNSDQSAEVTHTTMTTESTGNVTEDVAAFEAELDSLDAAADFEDFSADEFTQ